MKVLLATDGSALSEEAAALLAHLPHSGRLELDVLSVCQAAHVHGSSEVVSWIARNRDAERQSAELACSRVTKMFEGADAKIQCVTKDGHAGQEIVKHAEEMAADLIVLGAEGHSAISRMLLGSVSDFVATHAGCSVLVVRPTHRNTSDHKALRLCIAHDGSNASRFATQQLTEFVWRENCRIQIVSILSYPIAYTEIPIQIDMEPLRAAITKSAEAEANVLKKLSPNVDMHVIEAQHVGDAIVRFAERNDSDIILLGSTGQGLVGRVFLGSVANYVLRHSRCSVWIARDNAKPG